MKYCTLLLTALIFHGAVYAASTTLVINEIDYDQASIDTAEFIEIKNVSDTPVNLDPYSLELVNGTGGGASVYNTIDLPDIDVQAGGYYVICANPLTTPNCDLDASPDTNLIQNGAPDAVALKLGDTIIDTVSYEGDSGTPYTEGSGAGLVDTPITLESIARYPDGTDTDQNSVDLSLRCSTPGADNSENTPSLYYMDSDEDGFGAINDAGIHACTAPPFYVKNKSDCNDNDAQDYPGNIGIFTDIPPDFWAVREIESLSCAGISQGYQDNTYRPQLQVNRAQMAAFIIRALEGEPPEGSCGTTNPFADVPYTHWSCKYIKRLSELGISTGFGDGLYHPFDLVSRAQMAAYVVRALEGEPADSYCGSAGPFPDVPATHWACNYVKRLFELGVVAGFKDGLYRPTVTITRAQMAAFLAEPFLGPVWTKSRFNTRGLGTSEVYASIPGDNGGWISVKLSFPASGRYTAPGGVSEAPMIVEVPTYLTPPNPFYHSVDAETQGIIHVSFVWPGITDPDTGFSSDGTYDYGGDTCLSALRRVLRFVTGLSTTYDGYFVYYLGGGTGITPVKRNVGIYAFSHPGIISTQVMAVYGSQLSRVTYFVGRENPTQDIVTAVELGQWDLNLGIPNSIENPFYNYPSDYNAVDIDLGSDYNHVKWDSTGSGIPYFDDGAGNTYTLGDRVPKIQNKRLYSIRLLQALIDNGELTLATWPTDVVTPSEAAAAWQIRQTNTSYPFISSEAPWLKVMLVFAEYDHVQVALDKPHIHQAWDGFYTGAGLGFVRMNPDRVYVYDIYGGPVPDVPDIPANWEPSDWADMSLHAYPNLQGSSPPHADQYFPLAAVVEMADRTEFGDWSVNLSAVLH